MSLRSALASPPRGSVVAVIGAWTTGLHVVQLVLVTVLATPTRTTPVLVSLAVWAGVTLWGVLPRTMRRPEPAVAMALGAAAITANALWCGTPGVRELASIGMVGYVLAVGALSRGGWVLGADALILGCQALVVGASVGPDAFGLFAVVAATVTTAGACLAVWSLQTTLRQLLAKNRDAAVHDHLTGLLNRRGMELGFARLSAGVPPGHRIAALVLDLDRFKDVNDVHGHAVGDEVLRHVAGVLRDRSRHGDLLVRLGGEELAWFAAWPSPQAALGAAERLRHAVAVSRAPAGLSVTTSVGVAFSTDSDSDSDSGSGSDSGSSDAEALSRLLVRADVALYEAKRAGRDRVVLAAEGPDATGSADGATHDGAPAPLVRDGGSGRAGAEAQRA